MTRNYQIPWYLQRADLTPSGADLSRLNSDKLGCFLSEERLKKTQSHYSPKTHSPEHQPKFYVYAVQRREIFEEEEEEEDLNGEDEVNEQRNGLGNGRHLSGGGDGLDEDEGAMRAGRQRVDSDLEVLRGRDLEEEKRREAKVLSYQKKVAARKLSAMVTNHPSATATATLGSSPPTAATKSPTYPQVKPPSPTEAAAAAAAAKGKSLAATVQIVLSADSDESIDPTIVHKPSPLHDDTIALLRNNEADDLGVTPSPPPTGPQERELHSGPMVYALNVRREILKGSPFFNSPPNVGSYLQFIHLRLPRLDAVLAFLTSLEFLAKDRTELSDTDNLYELFALSHFLGLQDLQALCAKKLVKEMDFRKVVLCGQLGAMAKNTKMLKACYRWIGVNLVNKGLLATMKAEYEGSDQSRDLGHLELHLHMIANHMLSFNYAIISSAIFQDLFDLLAREKAPYYAAPAPGVCVELVLIRTRIEGEQPVYRIYDKMTGEFKMSALYSPDIGEYIISTSKTAKHINLYTDSYIGGIRSNLLGTGFTIFDFGAQNASECFQYAPPQTELGLVSYGRNLFGWEPREFSIAIPNDAKPNAGSETLMSAIERNQKSGFTFVYNKPPKWNEARNTYTLDFRNKVKRASKKNFILETEVDKKEVMMMGKIETDTFHLHYFAPFSLTVTFGIALSSFHKKMLVK